MEYETDRVDGTLLVEGCRELGITLSNEQIEQFLVYYRHLAERNRVMNLTAITEFQDVVQKHFLDSLSLVKVIDMEKCRSVIDVGTGAGFPGLPLKIVYPHLRVVLLDSLNKRITFLNELIDKFQFRNIEAVHGRAEDAARKKEYREHFDLCLSRAVANLSSLSEYCLPFVKKGGKFISYKSIHIDTELQEAKRAIFLLGGKLEKKEDFQIPGSEIERSLIVISKERGTPAQYPRKAGIPAREPISGYSGYRADR